MRMKRTNRGLALRVIAGSHVVLLAIDLPEADCPGLMGFAIHRTDHTEDEAYWIEGTKTFEKTDPGLPPGSKYATNRHPIQGFTWSDFTAKPGHRYTYRVQAMRGMPEALVKFRQVSATVTTESEAAGDHDVFFNRGAAGSQEFARRFGAMADLRKAPPSDPRWAWLSRGAAESILAFVARAEDARWSLRVAAYEFRLDDFATALAAARRRGVDVAVLYDGNANPPDAKGRVFPRDDNRETAARAGLEASCERITRAGVKSPPISHHKFIVLLKDGRAQAVLTGSTNFSRGGVFGQANVVHVVEDPAAAAAFLACWDLIRVNPDHADLRARLSALNRLPQDKPPRGTTTLMSPQSSDDALRWYAAQARSADGALFMTFAFGMNDLFQDAYRNGRAPLRYALLDKLVSPGISREKKAAAEKAMTKLRFAKENRFAVGNRLATNLFDRWLKESLSGLNQHVQYIHTKFMLVDPLGPDPVVVSGSANFSAASTTDNDENMLVIRGNRRVADIYLGEYMRLWNHYAFREWAAKQTTAPADTAFAHLDVGDQWWRGYFGDTARARQRRYFVGAR
jgi:phosphatidylserine/phosphatidylglycerophosphate/cardiolipin synthase-like enzyme